MNRNLLQILSNIFGYALFAVALWVIYENIRTYHFVDIASELSTLPLWRVGFAFLFLVLDYMFLTFYDVLALSYVGKKLPYPAIAVASFIGQIFSINMNFLTGSSMRYRMYSRWGITLHEVTHIVIFCYLSFLLGFLTVAGIILQLVPLVVPGNLQISTFPLPTIGILFLLFVFLHLLISSVRTNAITIWKWSLPPVPLHLALKQIGVASADWICGGTALYFLLPPSVHVGYLVLLGVYIVAQFAGQISQAPAGLGVFEATALLMLTPFGLSDAVIGSLLLYRLFYYFLPLAIATVLLGHEEIHPHERKPALKRSRSA